MTDETLKKANELKYEISKLEHFIYYAELCWSRLSFAEKLKRRMIRYKGYGGFSGSEYQLSQDLSKKLLATMKEHLEELEKQYKECGKNDDN